MPSAPLDGASLCFQETSQVDTGGGRSDASTPRQVTGGNGDPAQQGQEDRS